MKITDKVQKKIDERQVRLAKALRENLKRRKTQKRAQADTCNRDSVKESK